MVLRIPMTAEEFLTYADQHPDKRFDFIDGEVVEVSPKPVHGRIQAAFVVALDTYNKAHPVGVVYIEVLHVLDGDKFIPDVCINEATDGDYLTSPPLIVVDIRSDSESKESQRRKAHAYIKHGVQLVVLVLPSEDVEIYRPGQYVMVLTYGDVIDGGEALPGFQLPVAEIL